MNRDEQEDTTIYKWSSITRSNTRFGLQDRENPLGWFDGGKSGNQSGMSGLQSKRCGRHASSQPEEEDARDG